MADSRCGTVALALGLALGLSGVVLAGAVAGLQARPGAAAIAIFAPWSGLDANLAAVGRAGARVVDYGARGWILAVDGPDVQTALGREGAWLFLDIGRARALCGLTRA